VVDPGDGACLGACLCFLVGGERLEIQEALRASPCRVGDHDRDTGRPSTLPALAGQVADRVALVLGDPRRPAALDRPRQVRCVLACHVLHSTRKRLVPPGGLYDSLQATAARLSFGRAESRKAARTFRRCARAVVTDPVSRGSARPPRLSAADPSEWALIRRRPPCSMEHASLLVRLLPDGLSRGSHRESPRHTEGGQPVREGTGGLAGRPVGDGTTSPQDGLVEGLGSSRVRPPFGVSIESLVRKTALDGRAPPPRGGRERRMRRFNARP
jgi:hypothetical protein